MSARLSSTEAVAFLKTCEGAASEFSRDGLEWSLWMPELPTQDRPITPATQLCFPVILRNDDQAFAMRFYYDCSTGKMRYYAGAIPNDLARAAEFEAAVSAMFGNRLDVEPIKHRQLMKRDLQKSSAGSAKPRLPESRAWADPAPSNRLEDVIPAAPKARRSESPIQPKPENLQKLTPAPPNPVATKPATPAPTESPKLGPQPAESRVIRFELCERTRNVFLILAGVMLLLGLAAIGGWVYVQRNLDVGVLHHQMQLEAMRLRSNTP